jgi:hypothetical protein
LCSFLAFMLHSLPISSCRFHCSNDIWQVNTLKFLTVQFSPACCFHIGPPCSQTPVICGHAVKWDWVSRPYKTTRKTTF